MADSKFFVRSFNPKDLNEMYFAFLDAFENYPIPFRLNKEQFVRKFVQKLHMDFQFSAGAYDYEALASFIFTSVNFYKNKLTAYNGGTGVRPNYRGNRLTYKMYDFLIPKFQDKNIKQCTLEVLTVNEKAIKVYEEIGFEKAEIMFCFKLNRSLTPKSYEKGEEVKLWKPGFPNWEIYESFQDFSPTFLDSKNMVSLNISNEEIIEARLDDKIIGYAIYQPSIGRLSQIAVDRKYRGMGIGYLLMKHIYDQSYNKELTVLNVSEPDKPMKFFLEKLGFVNQINQFEMMLSLEK